MIKCVCTFIFQIGLVALIIQDTFPISDAYGGTWELNVSRLICAYLLHYQQIPELRCGLALQRYLISNRAKFTKASDVYPFLVAAMKALAGLYTEVVNIIVIVQSESVQDVVQNYIGFGIISDIDNMISDSIFQLDTDEILRASIMFPVA